MRQGINQPRDSDCRTCCQLIKTIIIVHETDLEADISEYQSKWEDNQKEIIMGKLEHERNEIDHMHRKK